MPLVCLNSATQQSVACLCDKYNFIQIPDHFYPRPVLAFGYCHRLRLWVCVCVYQSRACPHDNSSPIQAQITKFGPEMQNTLVWVPIVFGDDRPWSSRSNLSWKSNFTPFWACSHHYSSAIQARITKFGPKCILALPRSLLILDLIGFDLHFHFQSWNIFFYQIYLRPFCIYLVRPVACKY